MAMLTAVGNNIDFAELNDMFVGVRETKAYALEDGTIIKLSPYNPARALGEEFSEGQVIHFMDEDVFSKDESIEFKSVKRIKATYVNEEESGDKILTEEDCDSPLLNLYEGIVDQVIDLTDIPINDKTTQSMFRLICFNEQYSQEFFAQLFSLVVRDRLNGEPIIG